MFNPKLAEILRDSPLGDRIKSQSTQRIQKLQSKKSRHEEKQRLESFAARKKRQELTSEILRKCAEKFPKVFGGSKVPLKIGVKEDLLEALKDSGYSKKNINLALKYHLGSYQYYAAMLSQKKRYNLAGEVVEDISEEHLKYATKRLNILKRKFNRHKRPKET